MKHHIELFRFVFFLILFALPSLSAPKWIRLQTDRWELLTDAGEKNGRAVIQAAVEAESALEQMNGALPKPLPPVRILLFGSPKDFQPLQQGEANHGVFQSGLSRDYIFLENGPEALRAARHEAAHLYLQHASGPAARWMDEGFAEYFSNLQWKRDKVIAGQPIPSYLQVLSENSWNGADLPFQNSGRPVLLSYARSWGLVHVLLRDGAASKPLERVRGATMKQVAAASLTLDASIANKQFPARQFEPLREPQIKLGNADASEAEWYAARTEGLLAAGVTSPARDLLNEAKRKWPDDPKVEAGLGYLAMRDENFPVARQHLEKAIASGKPDAALLFEYAMLTRDTKGSDTLIEESLRKALAVNPSMAEAWFFLGTMALRRGDARAAIDSLQHATQILPRQSMFWEALGRAWLAGGLRDQAREAANRSLTAAKTENEKSMAEGLLRDLEAPAPQSSAVKPVTPAPNVFQPVKGDAAASGKLTLIDCATSTLKFHIQTTSAKIILATDKPNQVILRGATQQKREFVCGPQKAQPLVEATYKAAATPSAAELPKPEPAPVKKGAKKADPKKQSSSLPVSGELVSLDFK